MKTRFFILLIFLIAISPGVAQQTQPQTLWTYHWEIDETPEGQERATAVEPIEVTLLDEPVEIAAHSASLVLMQKYSVYLGAEWSPGHAYRLLQTFESIPHYVPYYFEAKKSLWQLSDRYLPNDIIEIETHDDLRIVTIAEAAFVHATPLLAEIEGVRGRYFSKRLHRAVVRFVSDSGVDRTILSFILQQRYAVSINIPNYTELTQHTTREHAGRFSEFKNEELIALVSMLEEFPSGMLKTPGLKYLVRRLDGTPHPTHPDAAAVAWTGAGYIEFMESAFKGQGADAIHRLILHEKAHFLWDHLFDEQLKSDWIEIGGWFENPDDPDGWSTTKQVEFVSAYAHGKNPNEDIAESISYYIVNPDKLRSRSPAKYEFIQNRVMHGTRYISKIREDLTFEVYNLYPDYVYPGRIVRVDIQVEGAPEEDKKVTVEIEIHGESDLDAAQRANISVVSDKDTRLGLVWIHPIDENGMGIASGHVLRRQVTVSKYAANGYWIPQYIKIYDAQGNERFESSTIDYGWKLYIDNPLADCEAPQYVANSMQLSLSEATTQEGRLYQILTARWLCTEKNGIRSVLAVINNENTETYSISGWGGISGRGSVVKKGDRLWEANVPLRVPDYLPSGSYKVNRILMRDLAINGGGVYFTEGGEDEPPATIEIQTTHPDTQPPTLDVNRIHIQAVPTQPDAPNGETRVDITFRIKDNISGYGHTHMYLRDPHGVTHFFRHYDKDFWDLYFSREPTVYETYQKIIILPVGSVPGTWGLAEMTVFDKAKNTQRHDFTEIVRFEVGEAAAAPIIASLPDDTQLLANYPNPFNPETWIPYQLTDASDVKITIYDVRGILVRVLPFGHQTAGYYTSRSRAAYWDGRNSAGEKVASGLYFYTITAGDFNATRKMLIRK